MLYCRCLFGFIRKSIPCSNRRWTNKIVEQAGVRGRGLNVVGVPKIVIVCFPDKRGGGAKSRK